MISSSSRWSRIFALSIAALLGSSAAQADSTVATGTTNDTGHNYNNSANWAGGVIDDTFKATALTGATTLYFSADRTTGANAGGIGSGLGLDAEYAGAFSLSLVGGSTDGTAAANHTVTLGGNILANMTGTTLTIGSNTANQNLTLNLGGATRTFTVGTSRTLSIVNPIVGTLPTDGLNIEGISSSGTTTLNAANTYSGATTVRSGTLNLAGSGATIANSALTINNGAIVTFNSNTNGMAGSTRAASLTMKGGTLNLVSNANTTASVSEVVTGNLDVEAGSAIISQNLATLRNSRITFGSYSRAAGGTVLFRGANLGANPIASQTAGSANVVFTTAPTLSGSGAANTTTVGIIPGAHGDTTLSTGLVSTGLVTYDSTNGVRFLNASEYSNTIVDGQTALENIKLANTSGTVVTKTLNAATSINSLTFDISGAGTNSGVTIDGTGSLLINSGIIFGRSTVTTAVASDIMLINGPTLDFGGKEAIVIVGQTITNGSSSGLSPAPLRIDSAITNLSSLTKSGSGQLTLGGTTSNTFTATTTVDAGVLVLSKTSGATALAGDLVINGGSVYWSANDQLADSASLTVNGGSANFRVSGSTGSSASDSLNNLTVTGGSVIAGAGSGGSLGVFGNATMAGGTLSIASSYKVNVAGLTDLSNGAVITTGSGGTGSAFATALTLNGGLAVTNTASGAYTPITLGVSGTAGTNGGRIVLSNGLTFTGNATNSNTTTIKATTGVGLTGTMALTGTNTFNIGNGAADADLTIQPGLTDGIAPGGVTKTGAGTLALSGASTYSGSTSVTAGRLLIAPGGSLTGNSTGVVTVNSGGVLQVDTTASINNMASVTAGSGGTIGGIGTINSPVVIASGGTLSPGNSPGTLSGTTLALQNGGNYNWQISDPATFDSMTLSGALDLSALTTPGAFSINLWSLSAVAPDVNGNMSGFNNALNQSWPLVSTNTAITGFTASEFAVNTGAANGTGGFTNTLGGGLFSVGLSLDNTDLMLTYTASVPEPGTWAILIGGLGLLGLAQKRRRPGSERRQAERSQAGISQAQGLQKCDGPCTANATLSRVNTYLIHSVRVPANGLFTRSHTNTHRNALILPCVAIPSGRSAMSRLHHRRVLPSPRQ